MEETNNDMALEKITSEVDETETKVFFSSYCLEAQEYLAGKLKKRCERHRETCSFINSTNFKVEAEIKHAEQEIRSMLITQESLKLGNVELRKQWLLATNKKTDIMKRVTEGKRKYEALWLETKNRYESIHFVKRLIQATERQKTAEKAIDDMDQQITKLYEEIETRRKICNDIDKQRCIELAKYTVTDMPSAINFIKKKSEQIKELNEEIEQLIKDKNVEVMPTTEITATPTVSAKSEIGKTVDVKNTSNTKIEHDPLIPKLNLVNLDLEIMGSNLNQVKIKKDEILNASISKTNYFKLHKFEQNVERVKDDKAYGYLVSPYFSPYKEEKPRNYSGRKLINILEDISINNSEVYNIVKKVQADKLTPVAEISAETVDVTVTANNAKLKSKDKVDKPIISEEIEEVDITLSSVDNVLVPPTQFLDISILDTNQKKVSFDLPSSLQIKEIIDDDKQDVEVLNESVNQSMTNQPDVSGASDDSIMQTKEMLLKQHNLDLSPQFVYAKTNILQRNDDRIVTSKFFQSLNKEEVGDKDVNTIDSEKAAKALKFSTDTEAHQQKDLTEAMDVDNFAVASPKSNEASVKNYEEFKSTAPVAGLLFTHGSQALPDSLNVSLSTAGYEDSDYPHCIDANLLLSPKADVENTTQNQGASSQEVPNFLSGFRKTFFFGGPSTSSEPKPDSSEQNEDNNFSFNFGGTKKNRGGLFSLFG